MDNNVVFLTSRGTWSVKYGNKYDEFHSLTIRVVDSSVMESIYATTTGATGRKIPLYVVTVQLLDATPPLPSGAMQNQTFNLLLTNMVGQEINKTLMDSIGTDKIYVLTHKAVPGITRDWYEPVLFERRESGCYN